MMKGVLSSSFLNIFIGRYFFFFKLFITLKKMYKIRNDIKKHSISNVEFSFVLLSFPKI